MTTDQATSWTGDFQTDSLRRDLLQHEFEQSDGLKLYLDFHALRLTFHTFQGNFEELDALVRRHYKLSIEHKLGDFFNRIPLDKLLVEVTRRLHNFVFAAQCVSAHTDKVVKRWYRLNPPVLAEYRAAKAKHFGQSGIDDFTSGLRDYFGHVTTPFIASVMAGSHPAADEPRFSLKLDTDAIYPNREGWTAAAQRYIASHKYGLNLGIYTREYYEAVIRFSSWLGERNQEWCKPIWGPALAIQDEIDAYEKRWGLERRQQKRLFF